MIDILLVAIVGLVTWCVASDGAWGAALTLLITIIAGLLAMSFFEPLATFLQSNFAGSVPWAQRWDIIALLGLFAGFVFALARLPRRFSRSILSSMASFTMCALGIRFPHRLYHDGHPADGPAHGTTPPRVSGLHPGAEELPRDVCAPTDSGWASPSMSPRKPFGAGPTDRSSMGPCRPQPGEPGELGLQKVWPSFPIRYASRRQQYASGRAAATPVNSPASPGSPPAGQPARGGTTGF